MEAQGHRASNIGSAAMLRSTTSVEGQVTPKHFQVVPNSEAAATAMANMVKAILESDRGI